MPTAIGEAHAKGARVLLRRTVVGKVEDSAQRQHPQRRGRLAVPQSLGKRPRPGIPEAGAPIQPQHGQGGQEACNRRQGLPQAWGAGRLGRPGADAAASFLQPRTAERRRDLLRHCGALKARAADIEHLEPPQRQHSVRDERELRVRRADVAARVSVCCSTSLRPTASTAG